MATTNTITDPQAPPADSQQSSLLLCLPSLPPDLLQQTLTHIAEAFPDEQLPVATPDGVQPVPPGSPLRLIPFTPTGGSDGSWILTADDYVNAATLAERFGANTILMLGGEAQNLTVDAIRALAAAVQPISGKPAVDLALACYDLGPREGLLNSAIFYPVTRALYGARPRFPLAVDLAMSARMAQKLGAVAQRCTAINQPDSLIWPVSEAALAGFPVQEVPVGARALPPATGQDLNALLTRFAGSLFADVENKAAVWQRARNTQPAHALRPQPAHDSPADIAPMLDSFRLAYTNLHEIWALVLPPASLFGLKRLSQLAPAAFRMPDALWARIVFDFMLAYRLRTINRGHLLGAMTPLYLAWVASHLQLVDSGMPPEQHIEELAAAFEADKPYLVSRWRWPDRFNP